jgi:hypothetical protein
MITINKEMNSFFIDNLGLSLQQEYEFLIPNSTKLFKGQFFSLSEVSLV